MTDEPDLTIEETVALLRQHAFTVPEDSDTADAGRTIIHSRLGGIGADWDLDDAIALAERSVWRGWGDSFTRHNLIIVEHDGDRERVYAFDVPRPKPVEPTHPDVQDVISLAIQRSRGEEGASMQALKDARFIREGLASAGWKLVRWDSGTEAPPLGPPRDEWSATPGKELAPRG